MLLQFTQCGISSITVLVDYRTITRQAVYSRPSIFRRVCVSSPVQCTEYACAWRSDSRTHWRWIRSPHTHTQTRHKRMYTSPQSNNDPILTPQPKTERAHGSQWQRSHCRGGGWGGRRRKNQPWVTSGSEWESGGMDASKQGAKQECRKPLGAQLGMERWTEGRRDGWMRQWGHALHQFDFGVQANIVKHATGHNDGQRVVRKC